MAIDGLRTRASHKPLNQASTPDHPNIEDTISRALNLLVHYSLPVYADGDYNPELVGTGFIVENSGRYYFVTAKHVLSEVSGKSCKAALNYSLRYDEFEVDNNDTTPLDNNAQNGEAWTAAIAYQLSKNFKVIGEWLYVEDENYSRLYFDQAVHSDSSQVQIALQWRL